MLDIAGKAQQLAPAIALGIHILFWLAALNFITFETTLYTKLWKCLSSAIEKLVFLSKVRRIKERTVS